MVQDKIEPNFEFQKSIGFPSYYYGDTPHLVDMMHRLFISMKETNEMHKKSCEFFRLDHRKPFPHEDFPLDYLVLQLKWGCKKEE